MHSTDTLRRQFDEYDDIEEIVDSLSHMNDDYNEKMKEKLSEKMNDDIMLNERFDQLVIENESLRNDNENLRIEREKLLDENQRLSKEIESTSNTENIQNIGINFISYFEF
jgi:hypothetical protein